MARWWWSCATRALLPRPPVPVVRPACPARSTARHVASLLFPPCAPVVGSHDDLGSLSGSLQVVVRHLGKLWGDNNVQGGRNVWVRVSVLACHHVASYTCCSSADREWDGGRVRKMAQHSCLHVCVPARSGQGRAGQRS